MWLHQAACFRLQRRNISHGVACVPNVVENRAVDNEIVFSLQIAGDLCREISYYICTFKVALVHRIYVFDVKHLEKARVGHKFELRVIARAEPNFEAISSNSLKPNVMVWRPSRSTRLGSDLYACSAQISSAKGRGMAIRRNSVLCALPDRRSHILPYVIAA